MTMHPHSSRIDWVNVAVWLGGLVFGAAVWIAFGVLVLGITDPAVTQ